MPLKIQHQMAETVMEVLDKKAKLKFYELNHTMAEALREEIIKDTGHPKLKAKCLDLISKLRVEQAVLNVTKTGKAPYVATPTSKPHTKEYDENGKEILSLDDNGQIRVGHGVEEIKELVNQGLVKQTYKKTTHGGTTAVGSGLGQMQLDPKTVKQLEAAADDAVKKTSSQMPSGTQQ